MFVLGPTFDPMILNDYVCNNVKSEVKFIKYTDNLRCNRYKISLILTFNVTELQSFFLSNRFK